MSVACIDANRRRGDVGIDVCVHPAASPVTGVVPAHTGRVVAEVERFVGGGFAGQVYRVNLRRVDPDGEPLVGLHVGRPYALKILKPPSGFARFFRDGLGMDNALFLDGGTAPGLYAPELGRNDPPSHGGYGPIIAVVK